MFLRLIHVSYIANYFFNHCILCIYLLHFLVPLIYSTLRLLPTFKLWITCTKRYQLIVPVPVFSPFKYIPTSRITSSNGNAYISLPHTMCVYVHECRHECEVREQLEEFVFVFYFVWHRVSSCLPEHTPGCLTCEPSGIICLSLSPITSWESWDYRYAPLCLSFTWVHFPSTYIDFKKQLLSFSKQFSKYL